MDRMDSRSSVIETMKVHSKVEKTWKSHEILKCYFPVLEKL